MTASAQVHYDSVSEGYAAFKRAHKPVPEEHTMRLLLGDLGGARVLDLACGFGHYTRLARELGAAAVIGVDISDEMVALARRLEAEQPRGVDYLVCDVAELPTIGAFDVATAVWLFNYAASPASLTDMFAAIRANLAPGGRLVGITVGPGYDPWGPSWDHYGLRVVEASRGTRRTHLVLDLLTLPPMRVRFSQWDRRVYDEASRAAGFGSVTWHSIKIPGTVLRAKGEQYWLACVV